MVPHVSPPSDDRVDPADEHQLALYARGEISAREAARRVLRRLGVEVPASLCDGHEPVPDRPQTAVPAPPEPDQPSDLSDRSSMREDTAMIARGELDIAGWLRRAERRYGQILGD